MRVTCRVPVRIDFAGAWTDVKFFAEEASKAGDPQGGAVVNAAINRYVEGRLETGASVGQSAEAGSEEALGIEHARGGLRVEYHSDLPSGSGLGTSAALNVCWLALIQSQTLARLAANGVIEQAKRVRLAEQAYELEEMLGILGGKQDQYAAALGGFHSLTFGATVGIERLEIAPETLEALESRLVLCYTGQSRLSGRIHENVWGAYKRGAVETVRALHSLRDGAFAMRTALLEGDLDRFGALIGDSWTHQKALDPSVTNERMEELFSVAADAGALSGKACGAGGGGCLLFFTPAGGQNVVDDALATAGARIIPFQFAMEGVEIRESE